ncbi:hypothetical protein SprV_0301017300 [Sparganum proliferum]
MQVNVELLEDAGNVRPTTCERKGARSKKSTFRQCVVLQNGLLPPPPTRLRLEEALNNAQRGREDHVLGRETYAPLLETFRKKPISDRGGGVPLQRESNQMGRILQPSNMSSSPRQPAQIRVRGDEGQENRQRNYGSLELRAFSPRSAQEAYQEEVHVRCRDDQALENRRHNEESSILLAASSAGSGVDAVYRPRVFGEANEIYSRGRGISAGGMRDVLNQGWTDSSGANFADPEPQRRSRAVAEFSGCREGQEMAAVLNRAAGDLATPRPSLHPRSVQPEGLSNAAREGTAMAGVFGREQPLDSFTGGDNSHYCPRVKYEGIENALKNRGSLRSGCLHSPQEEMFVKPVPRLRLEGEACADAHRGTATKMLMTRINELKPDPPPTPKVYAGGRKIANLSQGGAARECLNPPIPRKIPYRLKKSQVLSTETTRIDNGVAHQISKANQAFGQLQNSVRNGQGLQLDIELTYKVVVLTTLLLGAETWTVYSNNAKELNYFHLSCLRRILKVRWQNRIPDTEILERTDILGSHAMLRQLQLRWSGHLVRMEETQLPKHPFYVDVAIDSRKPGGLKRRYKDTLKNSLKGSHINPGTWENLLHNRPVLPSMKQIGSPPPKLNGRLANHKYIASSLTTIRRFQHARAADAHSAHESVSLDPRRHQSASVYLFSHSLPCRKLRADRHPRHRPATTIRPAPASTAAASITTTSLRSPPPPPIDWTKSDVS